jgi:hypothetical protein
MSLQLVMFHATGIARIVNNNGQFKIIKSNLPSNFLLLVLCACVLCAVCVCVPVCVLCASPTYSTVSLEGLNLRQTSFLLPDSESYGAIHTSFCISFSCMGSSNFAGEQHWHFFSSCVLLHCRDETRGPQWHMGALRSSSPVLESLLLCRVVQI